MDVRDTLSDLMHLLNRLVGEKVVLTLSHAQDLEKIKADKRQLEQVLMNLVVNACDAMPCGREIRVVTQNVTYLEQLECDHAIVPLGDYVLVKVTDEGHGIPPERLPKIFEPFYTTKRTGEGAGLRLLALLSRLVDSFLPKVKLIVARSFHCCFPLLKSLWRPPRYAGGFCIGLC